MSLGGLSLWQVADWDPEVWIHDLNLQKPMAPKTNLLFKTPKRGYPDVIADKPWLHGLYETRAEYERDLATKRSISPITPSIMPFNLGGFLNNAGRVLTGQPLQFSNQGGFVGPIAPTAVAPVPLAMGFLPAVGRAIGRGVIGRGKTVRDIAIGAVAGEVIGSGVNRATSGGNGQVSGGVMTTAQKRSEILEWAAIYVGLKRVRARDLQKMAQLVGWEYTADYYGLSALEVGFVVANMPKRRRRGITAADVRRVRSTARKFDTLKRSLSGIGGSTRKRSYRSSSSKASASCR